MIKMLDLFSGIGGFSYAGEKLVGGFETVAFCEYDKHAQKVLRKHWPDTEIIDDVRELANDAERFRGSVDIICGGYPCQPFSLAGVRRGDKDDRHLWPEMLRIIQAVRPTWVIGENVAGHISMGLDEVLSSMEAAGYQARCYVIPAVAADARHRRDRCWIIAHADREGEPASAVDEQRLARAYVGDAQHDGSFASGDIGRVQRKPDRQTQKIEQSEGSGDAGTSNAPNTASTRCESGQKWSRLGSEISRWQWWEPEPAVGRVANGVPGRVHRIRQLGNSIVPQVAARILYAIKEAHEQA